MLRKVFLSVAVTTLVPAIAVALVTPTAFFEGSQMFGTGRQIKAYRVPTRDQNNVIRYYDVTATFNVLPNGTISNTAAIVSVPSPNLASNRFIPGTYKDPSGTTVCTLSVSTLIGGRQQSAMTCRQTTYNISLSWITGPIPGHPFELDLRAANIQLIPGYQNYSWGKVNGAVGNSWWGCISNPNIISTVQVGNVIQLAGYYNSNTQACGTTLTKQ